MSSPGEALRVYWTARGVRFNPGVSEDVLRDFEARYGVELPADLRGYFAVLDGMNPSQDANSFGMDDDLFRFWPLSEVERASDFYHPDRFLEDQRSFFLFADYSISLPTYAIRLASEGKGDSTVIAIYSDRRKYETTAVADSFGGFVKRYLADRSSRMDLAAGTPLGPDMRKSVGVTRKLTDGPSHPLWDADLDD
jgi:hypothetical protein